MTTNDSTPRGIWGITATLLEGDPFEPSDWDVIVQVGRIYVGEKIPFGWNVLGDNARFSSIGRVAPRYEIEETTT